MTTKKRKKKIDFSKFKPRSEDTRHLLFITPTRISVAPHPDTCPQETVIQDAILLCAQTRVDVEVLFEDGAKLLQYIDIVKALMETDSP